MLSDNDRQRIAAAVAEAEGRTSGEIVCVLSREVSNYREIPIAWAAGAALLLPPLALLAGLNPMLLAQQERGWSAGHAGAQAWMVGAILAGYAVLQAMVFLATAALVALPAVRRRLTPASLKRRRVHRAALDQFLATGLHTEGRTGVVIFASEHDRKVEILAAPGINAKVGDKLWDEAAAAVVSQIKHGRPADGFVRAVEMCGAALAEHFPSQGPRANELSDLPIEL